MAREATIHRIKPFDLHGVRYYAFVYSYGNEPEVMREARVAHDAIYSDPKEGDTVLIEAILNMISEVTKKDAS